MKSRGPGNDGGEQVSDPIHRIEIPIPYTAPERKSHASAGARVAGVRIHVIEKKVTRSIGEGVPCRPHQRFG